MNGFRVPSEGKLGLRNGCQLKLGGTMLRFSTDADAIERFIASQNIAITGRENLSGSAVVDANNGKKRNKTAVYAVISFAAILVFVLAWCLTNHFVGSRRMAAGNYAAAFSAYKKDFLFSGTQRTESALLAGEAAYSAQDYAGAVEFFSAAGSAGKKQWSDAVYEQALVLIDNGNFDNAKNLLNKISDEPRAQEPLKLARFIANVNNALSTAASAVVEGSSEFQSSAVRQSFHKNAPQKEMVGRYGELNHESSDDLVITDLDALYNQCGKNPDGKILIIAQKHTFEGKTASQAILMNLMKLLPADYFPLSLDEVEYIVFVDYDYIKEGRYIITTVALKEFASVTVYKAADMQPIYSSEQIDGDSAPSSFYYHGVPPAWKSGGAPNMGKEIHSAICAIIH